MAIHTVSPKIRPSRQTGKLGFRNLIPILWGFTESDFATFAVPNTIFGILGALSGAFAADDEGVPPSSLRDIALRIPLILAFNWCNLLIFDMANQRSPISVVEDATNKPWRPIPSSKITPDQTRRVMLAVIPISLCFHSFLGLWNYGLGIVAGIWVYNDLGGGDEIFLREMVIALGYYVFNLGSLRIALGSQTQVSAKGNLWTMIISGVVLTTMQIQDLKDQEGDRLRGRRTIALFLGESFSRRSIAFFVGFWACICTWFWDSPVLICLPMIALSFLVMWRVLVRRGVSEDRWTWQIWCFWHSCFYLLPLIELFGSS
ncbi:UbiA prenyltransferase family-domain-containing protein [Rostrohypoxylon terebratum]|nr:UbiA prenyltransferase family-domain-containing protein [Rostrohypoxylon terebratum]